MLEFRRFDPARCQFPSPGAPLLPVLRWSDITWDGKDTIAPALLEGPGVRHFARGRYALQAAYRLAGVGPTGAVLVPAYHCRTMVDPALALGGTVHLYAMNTDLTPDMGSIKELLMQCRSGVRALVIPHYFGFEQPAALMQELMMLCRRHAILLVEDCSHAWQVAVKRAFVSQSCPGQVVIASPYKFFACEDGGVLWGHPEQLAAVRTYAQGFMRELKSFKNAWSRSRHGNKISLAPTEPALVEHRGEDCLTRSDQPSGLYDRALEGRQCLVLSRWVMRRARVSAVVQRRQQHYRLWMQAIAKLSSVRALFPELEPDCAPYMFPLLISKPELQFYPLKKSGLPIWRWDEMAVSACPVATQYRTHLLHLPCHQSLGASQMQWMVNMAVKVLT